MFGFDFPRLFCWFIIVLFALILVRLLGEVVLGLGFGICAFGFFVGLLEVCFVWVWGLLI